MSVTFCCRVLLILVVMRVPFCWFEEWSFLNLSSKCGAVWGKGMGLSGTGSSLASLAVVASMVRWAQSLSNSKLRFLIKMSRFLPGCTNDGKLGNTANAAISPQDNLSGLRPKYRHDAA